MCLKDDIACNIYIIKLILLVPGLVFSLMISIDKVPLSIYISCEHLSNILLLYGL